MVLGKRRANVHSRLGCSGPMTFVTILLQKRPSWLSGSLRGPPLVSPGGGGRLCMGSCTQHVWNTYSKG